MRFFGKHLPGSCWLCVRELLTRGCLWTLSRTRRPGASLALTFCKDRIMHDNYTFKTESSVILANIRCWSIVSHYTSLTFWGYYNRLREALGKSLKYYNTGILYFLKLRGGKLLPVQGPHPALWPVLPWLVVTKNEVYERLCKTEAIRKRRQGASSQTRCSWESGACVTQRVVTLWLQAPLCSHVDSQTR